MKIIVTGALGALGQAVTDRLRTAGHEVAGIDLHGGNGIAAYGDLANEEQAAHAVGAAARTLGGLDALVHLVGSFEWIPLEELSLATLRDLFSANVETYLAVAKAAIPLLRDEGAIVAVGAAAAQSAQMGMGGYTAAKSGVARLTEALSCELRPRGIRVNAILPAIIDTPRNRRDMPDTDPADWTSPEAIADVIEFLAGPGSRAINGGSILVTNPVSEAS
ncbi:SDR family oxidoreductase [Sphingopyxis fribergensis]